ncbi:hypothetical protein DFH06DRAFT_1486686 [Mycena polygramma]|nr:hypothetical protein DFH06DRAFT_1486686 [Mycena polygramma]
MSPLVLLLAPTFAAGVLLAIYYAWQTFSKYPPSWLQQLPSLGQPRSTMLPGTAIVCGGSIAGMMTARICADHFERVILIDPEIEDAEKSKTRILQFKAAHGFLALFVDGARRLWPEFDTEMEAAGGRFPPADVQLHYSGVPIPAPYSEYAKLPDTLLMRRRNVQKVMHRLLCQHPTSAKITILPGTVRCIHASEDGASIDSVTVQQLDGHSVTLHDAALVVDCTGTTQAGLKWLPAAGFKVPGTIRARYNGNMRYLCMTFDVPPALAAKLPIPAVQRETACVYVSAPHDDAQSTFVILPTGALPSNFVAAGDSSLQLNPVHGQGVAKIVLYGIVLNSLLHSVKPGSSHLPKDFSALYFKNSGPTLEALWDATRLHDYGSSKCQPMDGETRDTGRLVRWFERKLLSAATQDEEVASALWHVRHMLAADRALFAPSVLWKVLWTRSIFSNA